MADMTLYFDDDGNLLDGPAAREAALADGHSDKHAWTVWLLHRKLTIKLAE